jgi:hypothetical protein
MEETTVFFNLVLGDGKLGGDEHLQELQIFNANVSDTQRTVEVYHWYQDGMSTRAKVCHTVKSSAYPDV